MFTDQLYTYIKILKYIVLKYLRENNKNSSAHKIDTSNIKVLHSKVKVHINANKMQFKIALIKLLVKPADSSSLLGSEDQGYWLLCSAASTCSSQSQGGPKLSVCFM